MDTAVVVVGIHVVKGAPHVRQVAVDGTPILHPLTRMRTLRRRRSTGWRFYGEYRQPEWLGGGIVRLRLDQTERDVLVGFNREEHLRPIPPQIAESSLSAAETGTVALGAEDLLNRSRMANSASSVVTR
jgi:hypothetical protein